MNTIVSLDRHHRRNLIILVVLILALLSPFVHIYGTNPQSLNAGVAIGVSEYCQAGYETRGTPGWFAYCERINP